MLTLAYTSRASWDVSDDELAVLSSRAEERNASLGITGVLLFRDGRFVQIIEGPDEGVRAVYTSILSDPMHHNIHLVANEHIAVRRFPLWTMGYQSLDNVLGRDSPRPGNWFGAYPPKADLPDDIRQTQFLFDWLYDCWLGIAPIHVGPFTAGAVRDFEPILEAADVTNSSTDAVAATEFVRGGSVVVTTIYNKILTDVSSGVLLPGEILRDVTIAEVFGTSRTPVREALQKLRTIGVVESSNRLTRVAVVSSEKAAQSITVLAALYSAVLDEVIGQIGYPVIEAMRSDRLAFDVCVLIGNPMSIVNTAAQFYMRLVFESNNPLLKKMIEDFVQVVKLGAVHLEQLIGTAVVSASQEVVLAAAITGDIAEAQRGLQMLTASPAMSL